ncbi:MAG TPA: GGDEF domain-containing protein [Burkholderiaceae bacterium]|nr:GGDEF domain-containing protein [Burkholderiaceae bacterium]
MSKQQQPPQQNPADIAREAFRRLATRRIAPTPDAYRDIYDEIAGTSAHLNAESVLTRFAANIAGIPGDIGDFGVRFNRALATRDWHDYSNTLNQLTDQRLKPVTAGIFTTTPTAKEAVPQPGAKAESPSDSAQARVLRDLLARTLTLAVASLLQGAPELAAESEALGASIKDAQTEEALADVAARLKQLCFKIELKSGDMAEEHELLLRLFKLLLENISELLDDESWLGGQIAGVQNLLAGPISHSALKDATRSLKEVIYKQGILRHSLTEAKVTVKNMMITFIDRLSAVATTTGDYHQKIDKYSRDISQARDIDALNRILEDVMHDTKATQTEALRSRDEMISARQDVQQTEARIHDLETRLEQMSELVREDQLTGSLNRRGLDDVFERELARAERRNTPLCVAMLDLDDFKRLNDTYGHTAGDEVLIHLVRVIKDTLRTMDVIARFGGEEFLIVLPDTPLEEAKQTITRLQRELTKRIFMHNHERLLITFSAGVALRGPQEDQAALIKRADEALYKAKRAGKNRVIAAE